MKKYSFSSFCLAIVLVLPLLAEERFSNPAELVEEAISIEVPSAENTGVLKMEEPRNWIDATHEFLEKI